MGFQRVCNPLVRSRAESPCRVWGCGSPVETSAKQKHRPSRQARLKAPHFALNAPQRVNFQTVQWTVWKEGDSLLCREMSRSDRGCRTRLVSPCTRGRSLKIKDFFDKLKDAPTSVLYFLLYKFSLKMIHFVLNYLSLKVLEGLLFLFESAVEIFNGYYLVTGYASLSDMRKTAFLRFIYSL